jgi:hypothetical protein
MGRSFGYGPFASQESIKWGGPLDETGKTEVLCQSRCGTIRIPLCRFLVCCCSKIVDLRTLLSRLCLYYLLPQISSLEIYFCRSHQFWIVKTLGSKFLLAATHEGPG